MQSENLILVEKFEEEVLLYIEKQLDPGRLKYWDEQISLSPELRKVLNETLNVLNVYSVQALHDIAEPEFDKMIKTASAPKNILRKIIDKLTGSSKIENELGINSSKIAFGSMLVVASIVMLLLTDKPNTVKEISGDLLDWDAADIHKQLDEIDGGISLMEDENLKQYMLFKMTNDEWSRDYYKIEKDIQELIDETDNRSM